MHVCFFGDSLTLGVGDPAFLGWPGRVCAVVRSQGTDLTAYNLGVRRDATPLVAARWRAEAAPRLDDIPDPGKGVVFCCGVADVFRGVDAAESRKAWKAMLAEAKALYPVACVSPLPVRDPEKNALVKALSADYAKICRELSLPYLDAYTAMAASAPYKADLAPGGRHDGVHPGANGYSALAAQAGDWQPLVALLGGRP